MVIKMILYLLLATRRTWGCNVDCESCFVLGKQWVEYCLYRNNCSLELCLKGSNRCYNGCDKYREGTGTCELKEKYCQDDYSSDSDGELISYHPMPEATACLWTINLKDVLDLENGDYVKFKFMFTLADIGVIDIFTYKLGEGEMY